MNRNRPPDLGRARPVPRPSLDPRRRRADCMRIIRWGTVWGRDGAVRSRDMPHVLVVEDDPATARVLCQVLKSRGAGLVVHAGTVADALNSLDPAPDWVILDLDLPDGL